MQAQLAALVGDDDPLDVAAGRSTVDPETAARLRSLGYLGGSTTAAPSDRGVDPKDRIAAYESFTRGFEDATAAVRAGRWGEAESRLRALDRIAPDQFIIQHYLGRTALGRGDATAAVALLERSVQLNPSYYSPTHVELARAYRGVGQPERAIELLEGGVAAHPNDFALRFNLGYHLQASGRLDEAFAAYQQAAELVPGYAPLYTNIASIHLARGEPDAALAAMREALAIEPDDGRTWGNVGMVLGGTGRFAEAEQAFRRATELLPDEAPMHFNLGLALMRQGKNEEAITALRRALEIDPDMAAAREALRALGGGSSSTPAQ
jgi:tetratricopeptide (TPR) repeat protein